MKFRVNVSDEVERLIENQVQFIAIEKGEPQSAAIWASDVDGAMASLMHMPARCALAPENKLTSQTIRMLSVHNHVILFTIDEKAHEVNVLSLRAGRQLPLKNL